MLSVLFQNDAFVVVDKPAGWLSVPSRMGVDDPRPCVGPTLAAELGVRLWPVHRLDLEVSGILLFARSAEAHRQACAWFEGRTVHKTYQALSEGTAPSAADCVWTGLIAKGKKRAFAAPHGKPSATRARCLGTRSAAGIEALVWELQPITGRPHQLRFDLARHGYPILGDTLYGSTRPYEAAAAAAPALPAIALRAVLLDFRDAPGARTVGLPDLLAAPPL